MKFTTPCFVCVEDAEERRELIAWSENIGYCLESNYDDAHFIYTTRQTHVHNDYECGYEETSVNCGTNIALFKALAAMNDENDYMQWFTSVACPTMWLYTHKDTRETIGYKATAKEIIEHFKN
jgi:hypothetical protein